MQDYNGRRVSLVLFVVLVFLTGSCTQLCAFSASAVLEIGFVSLKDSAIPWKPLPLEFSHPHMTKTASQGSFKASFILFSTGLGKKSCRTASAQWYNLCFNYSWHMSLTDCFLTDSFLSFHCLFFLLQKTLMSLFFQQRWRLQPFERSEDRDRNRKLFFYYCKCCRFCCNCVVFPTCHKTGVRNTW